jgi:predicted CopG family antitoxin
MATKTITVTEDAYEALKALKTRGESFSETIIRVAKRKPLSAFFGALSKESGERLERAVSELRERRNAAHRARMKHIARELGA